MLVRPRNTAVYPVYHHGDNTRRLVCLDLVYAGESHRVSLHSMHTFTHLLLPININLICIYILLTPSLSQLVHISSWSWPVFGQLVIVNIALNQAWVALLIWLILTFPKNAFRLSPPLASVMGFTSGFFIPIGDIPWW